MDGHLSLPAKERKAVWRLFGRRARCDAPWGLRLVADGWSYRDSGRAAFAGPSLVRAVKRDHAAGGVNRVLGTTPRPITVAAWLPAVVRWLLRHTPRDFGFFRSRWSCGLLAA